MPEQDNRPAVYLEGNTAIYRASAMGHCVRMLWAARSGLDARPIPAAIKKAMDEGTELEPIILNMLFEEHDFTFGYQGQGAQFQIEVDVGTFNGIRCVIRGKVDEIGHCLSNPLNGDLTIDVKAFKQALVDEYRSKGIMGIPRYAWQQTAYGIGFGKQHFLMPIYNKDTGKIEEWSLEPIAVPLTFEHLRDRVMTVEEHISNGTMPDDCPAEFGCQYYYLHDNEQKVEDELPEKVIPLLKARIAISGKIDTFNKAKAELDKAIRPLLTKDVQYRLEGHTITVSANPDKFNTAAAKALLTAAEVDWQDHSSEFWTPGEGTQLRVNKPKAKGDKE